ncbi:hypothetical protein JCM9279_006019 [Rhodotorula babjevae]
MMTTTHEHEGPCQACLEGHRLEGEPKGSMQKLNSLGYYFAKGSGEHTDKALVLGTDLFGLGLPNPKLMADWFAAKSGLDVLVPDVFEGDYVNASRIQPQIDLMDEPTKGKSFLWRLKYHANALYAFYFGIGPTYLFRHSATHTLSLAEKFCLDMRKEAGYTRIGFVGYCWGGAHAVHLATSAHVPKPVDVVVAFHPAPIAAKDFKGIGVPFMLSCAGEDAFFDPIKPAVLSTLSALAVERGTPIKTWDDAHGTVHGYGARPDLAKVEVREAFALGLERTAQWFKEHL